MTQGSTDAGSVVCVVDVDDHSLDCGLICRVQVRRIGVFYFCSHCFSCDMCLCTLFVVAVPYQPCEVYALQLSGLFTFVGLFAC